MPTVAAVATLEPEVAANIPQAAMFECMRPPGSQDTQWTSEPYMRSANPERSRISPSRMNSGTDTSRNSFEADQDTSPSARTRGSWENTCSSIRASTPIDAATGMASAISTSSTVSVVAIMGSRPRSGARRRLPLRLPR